MSGWREGREKQIPRAARDDNGGGTGWGEPHAGFFLLLLLGAAGQLLIAAAENKVFTDADKGGQVRLKVGEGFEVRLKANPSTGFMWYLHKNSTPLLKLVSQTETEPKEPGVGRPGIQSFKFEAKRAGEGVLLLHYVRSWEKPAPDEEQFDLHVIIE